MYIRILNFLIFAFVLRNTQSSIYQLHSVSSPKCNNLSNFDDVLIKQITVFVGGPSIQRNNRLNDSGSIEDSMRERRTCALTVKPFGRMVHEHYANQGDNLFWFMRFHIIKHSACLSGYLTILFNRSLAKKPPSFSREVNVTCDGVREVIDLESKRSERIAALTWTQGSVDDNPKRERLLEVKLIQQMLFWGAFNESSKQSICIKRNAVWCGDGMPVCIHENYYCDGEINCFYGGLDEANCHQIDRMPPSINSTNVPKPTGIWNGSFIWTVLIILPLILLFALLRICTQRRNFELTEDELKELQCMEKLDADNNGGNHHYTYVETTDGSSYSRQCTEKSDPDNDDMPLYSQTQRLVRSESLVEELSNDPILTKLDTEFIPMVTTDAYHVKYNDPPQNLIADLHASDATTTHPDQDCQNDGNLHS